MQKFMAQKAKGEILLAELQRKQTKMRSPLSALLVNADIYGASSNGSNVILNKVYIQSDIKTRAKTRNLYGGKTMTGSANQNEVNAISSDIQGDIYGGYSGYGLGDTNENKITIENSNVSGSVYGGYNEGSVGSAINNIVNLKNTVMIGGDIVGGESGSGTHIRGNTLNIRSNKIAAGNVKNFETYTFTYLKIQKQTLVY